MSLLSRLEKLEKSRPSVEVKDSWDEWEEKRFNCTHPAGSFHIRREYPLRRIVGRTSVLVTAGHCDNCGFDSPLWDVSNATDEEFTRLSELINEHHSAGMEYALELIAAGRLDYTAWPPPQEIIDQVKSRGANNFPVEIAFFETD